MVVMLPVLSLIIQISLHESTATMIDCRTSDCTQDIINCPSNSECIIHCSSDGACTDSAINCPQNGSCNVYCDGTNACKGLTINATLSSKLRVVSLGYKSGPSNISCTSDAWSTNTSCEIDGIGTDYPQYDNVQISGDSEHVRISCQCGDNSCVRNTTLICASDFKNNCDINDTIDYYTYNTGSLCILSPSQSQSSISPTSACGSAKRYNPNWITTILIGSGTLIIIILFIMYHIRYKRNSKNYALQKKILKPVESNSYKGDDDMYKWLEAMEMEEYYDTFISNGYKNLNFVVKITDDIDLENIGITLKGHQKMLLDGIEKEQMQRSDMQLLRGSIHGCDIIPGNMQQYTSDEAESTQNEVDEYANSKMDVPKGTRTGNITLSSPRSTTYSVVEGRTKITALSPALPPVLMPLAIRQKTRSMESLYQTPDMNTPTLDGYTRGGDTTMVTKLARSPYDLNLDMKVNDAGFNIKPQNITVEVVEEHVDGMGTPNEKRYLTPFPLETVQEADVDDMKDDE